MSCPQYSPPQSPQHTQPQVWQGGEPPLWAPYYGAPFPAAVKRFFAKYSTFAGRASRSEYWWWTLVAAIVSMVLNVSALVLSAAGASVPGPGSTIGLILIIVWFVAVIVPSLALTVRRLHDVNFSGWMLLLGLVPFVGGIILLAFTVLEPKPEGQRFDQPGSKAGRQDKL